MIAAVHRWLKAQHGKRACALAFAAGALMTLGFAPLHLWPVLFISLPVFYLLLEGANRAQSLWRGFFFGYGYSMAGTWWVANSLLVDAAKFGWMLPFSVLGLSAVMALWFVALAALLYRFRGCYSVLFFAAMWVAVEYLRSLGMFGFPWNLVGYMSLASLHIAQTASLIGVYGLSLLLVLLGLLPIYFLNPHTRTQRQRTLAIAVLVFGAVFFYGQHRLSTPTEMTSTRLRIVQPNIPQEVKGSREGRELAGKIFGELSPVAKGETPPDVTIWPETAYPYTIRPDTAHPLPDHVPLLITGAVRSEGRPPQVKIWNSVIALNWAGELLATYDKHQLVPFGEFVPLREVLPLDKITPGELDFTRGSGPTTIALEKLPPFSPLVCYEVIFPWLAVDAKQRPEWLLNVTNDGWFGDSPGPHQHFDMARMRAIEQGLPLVRAANNGISAVVDGSGRITGSLGLYERGVLDRALPQKRAATYYHRWKNIPILIILLVIGLWRYFSKNRCKK